MRPDRWYAIHPDRVVPGAQAERGVVLGGPVVSTRPFGARYECVVSDRSGEQFKVHLDEAPTTGAVVTLTALDPPVVGA